jgi:hypothetical protein
MGFSPEPAIRPTGLAPAARLGRIRGLVAISEGVRKVNPWKTGTKGHVYYAKYRTGMTVAEAVKAGVPRGYIAWDIAHGFITIKSEA